MSALDGVVDAEIYTEVTVALTASQVAWLRSAEAWLAADRAADTAGDILRAVGRALPVQLTIELDGITCWWLAGLAGRTAGEPTQLTASEVAALDAVRAAVKARSAKP